MSAYQQLEAIFTKLSHLNHLQAITGWDEAVIMPPGGGKARAQAMAALSSIIHETLTQPQINDLIEQAKQENLSDDWQKANLKLIEKKYRQATCLPPELVQQSTEAAIRCEQAWRTLRAENNWNDFAPLLAKNIKFAKEIAKNRADVFKVSPYDALLDSFIPDVNQALIDPIFDQLKRELPPLIQQAIEKQKSEPIIHPKGRFPIPLQRQLALELMQAIGFDFNHGRLDVSHHPFCGGVPEDVRITTRYNESEFITSAMAICHETGHARYEQGLPKKWIQQPVGEALGMAMHESQSLLVEMQVCRTKEFMQFLSPLMINQFGEDPCFNPENLFRLYTRVKPDYIRVDADEMTYPLHVILRYELEKALISGDLTVEQLPDAWNDAMKKYLGLSTKNNYQNGIMQDVHWPAAIFGYFPAYTLGSLIAAQLFSHAKLHHPDILQHVGRGDFTLLFSWLGEHVHSRGSSVNFSQLIQDATGEKLTADYFIEHIKARYL